MGQTNTPTNSARYAHRSFDFSQIYKNSQKIGDKNESNYIYKL